MKIFCAAAVLCAPAVMRIVTLSTSQNEFSHRQTHLEIEKDQIDVPHAQLRGFLARMGDYAK